MLWDVSVADDAKSGPFLAWRTEPGGPYTSTPVAYRGLLYSVRDEGILSAFDLATGQRVYQQRTNGTHAASLLASDGRVYVTAEGGEVLVVKAGRSFEVLARNDMGESCMATPAIANGTLFVRTRRHVYAIGATKAAGLQIPPGAHPVRGGNPRRGYHSGTERIATRGVADPTRARLRRA